MFYHQPTNKYIQENTQFELEGITYPPQWLNQATPEQKSLLGLEEVVVTNEPYNPKYYWTGETLDGVSLTYTGTPKDLDEVKFNSIKTIKQIVYSLLSSSDYIDIRNLRDPSYKPEWITWRNSVRQVSNDIETSINSAINVDEIAEIMTNIVWPNDPNYIEPIVE